MSDFAAHLSMNRSKAEIRDVAVTPVGLTGTLRIPKGADCVIVFAHGSGSSRFSPRNIEVANALAERGFGTLLFDLLTEDEAANRANVFDISLLAQRVTDAVNWLGRDNAARRLAIGLFGASTGAAAALVAAAQLGTSIRAVVSRGGRPDMANHALKDVLSPTQLIVGGADSEVLELNRQAFERLKCQKSLVVVPGATHLFSEKGALEEVIKHACGWFAGHMHINGKRDVVQG